MDTKALIATLFKVHGQPFPASPTQVQIFEEIFQQKHHYAQTIVTTQFGKSAIVSAAAMLRSLVFKQDVAIVSSSDPKAQIIMGYIRNHIFDNSFFTSQVELDDSESLDHLRKERSRKKITWKYGGSVRTVSVDARQADRPDKAMGESAHVVIVDESCLIPDLLYSTIPRMTSGLPFEQTQLFEISNPFYRNHFFQTWNDEEYAKYFLDWRGAVAEGRLDIRTVERARKLPLFDVLYECKFPDEDEIDAEGYRQLLTSKVLDAAIVSALPHPDNVGNSEMIMGVDVGGGGDDTIIALRNQELAWVELKAKTRDTMTVVTEVERLCHKWHVEPSNVFIDDIGVGRGVCDRLKEKGLNVNGVSVGDRPITEQGRDRYLNIKSENYLALAAWVEASGRLVQDSDWEQLTWIKYKVNSDKNIQIERKEKLKARVGRSPDTAEALMLTFTKKRPQPRSWVI